jgi:hypothetical protein
VRIFDVVIASAERALWTVPPQHASAPAQHSAHGSATGVGLRAGVVTLQGDALLSSHFRLGIGVNKAASALPLLVRFMRAVSALNSTAASDSQSWNAAMQAAAADWLSTLQPFSDALGQLQRAAIFYEAYCNLLVSLDYQRTRSERASRCGFASSGLPASSVSWHALSCFDAGLPDSLDVHERLIDGVGQRSGRRVAVHTNGERVAFNDYWKLSAEEATQICAAQVRLPFAAL